MNVKLHGLYFLLNAISIGKQLSTAATNAFVKVGYLAIGDDGRSYSLTTSGEAMLAALTEAVVAVEDEETLGTLNFNSEVDKVGIPKPPLAETSWLG